MSKHIERGVLSPSVLQTHSLITPQQEATRKQQWGLPVGCCVFSRVLEMLARSVNLFRADKVIEEELDAFERVEDGRSRHRPLCIRNNPSRHLQHAAAHSPSNSLSSAVGRSTSAPCLLPFNCPANRLSDTNESTAALQLESHRTFHISDVFVFCI